MNTRNNEPSRSFIEKERIAKGRQYLKELIVNKTDPYTKYELDYIKLAQRNIDRVISTEEFDPYVKAQIQLVFTKADEVILRTKQSPFAKINSSGLFRHAMENGLDERLTGIVSSLVSLLEGTGRINDQACLNKRVLRHNLM